MNREFTMPLERWRELERKVETLEARIGRIETYLRIIIALGTVSVALILSMFGAIVAIAIGR